VSSIAASEDALLIAASSSITALSVLEVSSIMEPSLDVPSSFVTLPVAEELHAARSKERDKAAIIFLDMEKEGKK
jgi:hypothetical protein